MWKLYYALFKQSEFNNLKLVNDRIKKALRILRFLLFYTPTTRKVKEIKIDLFLTDLKKTLPKNQIKTLGQDNLIVL